MSLLLYDILQLFQVRLDRLEGSETLISSENLRGTKKFSNQDK